MSLTRASGSNPQYRVQTGDLARGVCNRHITKEGREKVELKRMDWRKEVSNREEWLELQQGTIFWSPKEKRVVIVRDLTENESDWGTSESTLDLISDNEGNSNEYAIVNSFSTDEFLKMADQSSKAIREVLQQREKTMAEIDKSEKTCQKCGRKLKTFHHNCPNTSSYDEKFGCPYCDDVCPACQDEEDENENEDDKCSECGVKLTVKNQYSSLKPYICKKCAKKREYEEQEE